MAKVHEASLLGLPTEIRCQIYKELLSCDLNCALFERWRARDDYELGGHIRRLDRKPGARLLVPWVALQSVCRTVASEVRGFMQLNTTSQDSRSKTWELDMHLLSTHDYEKKSDTGDMSWQRLPCQPKVAQTLFIRLFVPGERRLEGYFEIDFWQTLNYIVHCGPRMDTSRPLRYAMRIPEVKIELIYETAVQNVHGAATDDSRLTGNAPNPWYFESNLHYAVKCWCESQIGGRSIQKFSILGIAAVKSYLKPIYYVNLDERYIPWLDEFVWGMRDVLKDPPRRLSKAEIEVIERRKAKKLLLQEEKARKEDEERRRFHEYQALDEGKSSREARRAHEAYHKSSTLPSVQHPSHPCYGHCHTDMCQTYSQHRRLKGKGGVELSWRRLADLSSTLWRRAA